MRQFLQKLLTKPVIKLANAISSRPDEQRVDAALTDLYNQINEDTLQKGRVIPFNSQSEKFVILSDQHKGVRDGADIFAKAADNYLAALAWYYTQDFFYINLGDSEELWENLLVNVKKHNGNTFDKEQAFLDKEKFIKIYGNHDLYWDNDPLAEINLKEIYGQRIPIYEGVVLKTTINESPLEIYMTHGHQGDLQSDGNKFSKWFVSDIWGPFQAYLRINPNTPSTNNALKTAHNKMMYEWSSKRKNTLLITGHTHQPVFKSFTHIELLYSQLDEAKEKQDTTAIAQITTELKLVKAKDTNLPQFKGYLDTYFNSGCCCFDDGDITGIELENECIRLIKWKYNAGKLSERIVLEESKLAALKVCV